MSRYYLLTTLNKSLRTYHETSLCTDVPPPSEKKNRFFSEGGGTSVVKRILVFKR